MITQVLAEEWDSGAGESFSGGVFWWAECQACRWTSNPRASKRWATRDAHNHERANHKT